MAAATQRINKVSTFPEQNMLEIGFESGKRRQFLSGMKAQALLYQWMSGKISDDSFVTELEASNSLQS